MLPTYGLARTTSGLLAINAWNGDSLPGSASPFVVADWTASTTTTMTLKADKSLQFAEGNAGLWSDIQRTSIASRAKTFFYYMGQAETIAQGFFGPAAHITQVTTPTCTGGLLSVQRGAGERVFVADWTNGTEATITSTGVANKTHGVEYITSLFVDGTTVLIWDKVSATTVTGTSAKSSGQVGIVFNGTTTSCQRWIAMADRYVTVAGLPSGATVDIQTPSATTLVVGGDESSGTATIDLFLVDVAQAQSLRVLDHLGTVLATFRDSSGGASNNLIAGGDAFTLSSFPVGAQTIALQAVKLASTF